MPDPKLDLAIRALVKRYNEDPRMPPKGFVFSHQWDGDELMLNCTGVYDEDWKYDLSYAITSAILGELVFTALVVLNESRSGVGEGAWEIVEGGMLWHGERTDGSSGIDGLECVVRYVERDVEKENGV